MLQSKYIAECIDEIKQELRQDNIAIKANAVNKLCYVSITWVSLAFVSVHLVPLGYKWFYDVYTW